MVCSFVSVLFALTAHAAAAQPREKIQPEALDRKIEQVIHQPRFAWRMPRQSATSKEAEKSFLFRFAGQVLKTAAQWIAQFMEWLKELMRDKDLNASQGHDRPSRQQLQASLYALVAVILAAAAYLFWRSRKTKTATAASLPIAPALDLTAAEISPALLEEDGWLALAREFIAKNEPLMALRAYYLAALAFLATKELVRPNAAKSNREYHTELARRSRSTPELAPVFARNVLLFERCWYGGRTVQRESLDEFLANFERIRSLAQ